MTNEKLEAAYRRCIDDAYSEGVDGIHERLDDDAILATEYLRLRMADEEGRCDSKRLDWLLKFLLVDDAGCDRCIPGLVVRAEDLEEAAAAGAAVACHGKGWRDLIDVDLRAVIDAAMDAEAKGGGK